MHQNKDSVICETILNMLNVFQYDYTIFKKFAFDGMV